MPSTARRRLQGRLYRLLELVVLCVPGIPFGATDDAARFAKYVLVHSDNSAFRVLAFLMTPQKLRNPVELFTFRQWCLNFNSFKVCAIYNFGLSLCFYITYIPPSVHTYVLFH